MTWNDIGTGLLEIWGKSALVLALGLGIGYFIRRRHAAIRHEIWLWVLFAVIAVPVVSLVFPRWEVIPAWWNSAASPQIEFAIASEPIPVSQGTAPAQAAPASPSFWSRLSWQGALAMIWFLGAIVILARSVIAGLWLHRLQKVADATPRRVVAFADSLRSRLGVNRTIEIFTSVAVPSPFSWGLLRPRIALPAEAADWSSGAIEMALLHELEHIRRRDSVAVLLGRVVVILNWLNPLSWLVVRNMEECREEACDAQVLASGYPAERYAGLLLSQANSVFPPIKSCATAVAEHGTLERRIKMILNRKPQENSLQTSYATRWFLCGLITVSSLLTGVVGWIDSGLAEQEKAAKPEPKPQFILIQSQPDSETPILLKLNGVSIDRKELIKRLEAIPKPERHVVLGAGDSIPLGEVTAVLDLVKKAGVETVKLGPADFMKVAGSQGAPAGEDSPLVKKLKAITIPSIEFIDTPLGDAMAFLVSRSRETDPDSGINVILEEGLSARPVTLRLSNASLADALRFSADLAGAQITVEPHAVLIGSKKAESGSRNSLALADPSSAESVKVKLEKIVIPNIEFRETPLRDALDFLRARSEELDINSPPDERGVNMVMSLPPDSGRAIKDLKVTLELRKIPLGDALKYTVQLAGLRLEVQGNAVVVLPPKSD